MTSCNLFSLSQQVSHLRFRLQRQTPAAQQGAVLKKPGESCDFSAIRPYQWGDSIKHIDWNASARSHQLQTRIYHAEKYDMMYFFVDSSASMALPGGTNSRWLVAKQLITMLSAIALRSHIHTGLIMRNSQEEQYLVAEHQACTPAKINALLMQTLLAGAFSLSPLPPLLAQMQRKAYVFLLSDGYFDVDAACPMLQHLASHHRLTCIQLSSSTDHSLPASGMLTVLDSETQQHVMIDCSNDAVRTAFSDLTARRQAHFSALMQRLGIHHVTHLAGTPLLNTVTHIVNQTR